MSQLTIQQKHVFLGLSVPHMILIDGKSIGVMKGRSVVLDIPSGQYDITIQSMFPFISGTQNIQIPFRGHTTLAFSERDGWMEPIFTLDIFLSILKLFVSFPSPWNWIYEIITNGYFILWLVWVWCIRKRYFRIHVAQTTGTDYSIY